MSKYDISGIYLNNYVAFKDCHDEPIEDVHDLGDVVTFKHDGIGYFCVKKDGSFSAIDPEKRNTKYDLSDRFACIVWNEEGVNPAPEDLKTPDPKADPKETVNHPSHYNQNGLETIDIIKAFCAELDGIEGFDIGNCLKYLTRWRHKNGIEDLKKAKWYLEHVIQYEETKGKE